jgi:hypothetical protein
LGAEALDKNSNAPWNDAKKEWCEIINLVLGQSLRLAAVGIVWGAAVALAVSDLLSAQLFGVSARDPRVYAGVALLILVVTLLASALPTLRAACSSPHRRPAHRPVDDRILQFARSGPLRDMASPKGVKRGRA